MKVLIIEDSLDFRNKLKGMLEDDYEVETAVDGLEGLQKIKDQRYDLIITDLNMPNLDGLAMLKKVKELDLGYECPPIMMCTTEFDPTLKKEGKSAGVSFWLVKPISENKFIKVVDSLLES